MQSISVLEAGNATLAQLVEQRIRNAQVEGSNPLSGSASVTPSGCAFFRSPLQYHPVLMLQLIHHERALQRSQMLDGPQDIQHELLVILHIRRMNLQQIIILP